MVAPWCSREGSSVPDMGVGSPQASGGGGEVAGVRLQAAWAEPEAGSRGELYLAKQIQGGERIKG